jgi:tetratricopeptide (TPR) repeat protein
LKATCLDAVGAPSDALAEYEKLTESYPNDAEVWVHMADLCHGALDDPEMAADALTTALEIAEGDDAPDEEMAFEAHLRLVDAMLDLDAVEDAMQHAEAARKLDRESADAHAAVAHVHFECGRFGDAEKAAALAVDRDTKNASGWFIRGLILERKGDQEGARRAFERMRTADPEFFPPPVEMSPEGLLELAREVIPELAAPPRNYLADVKLSVVDLPADVDLRSSGGTLTPSAAAAMQGTPLEEERQDPFSHKPSGLILYRLNLLRNAADLDEIRDRVEMALLAEVADFLHLSGDALLEPSAND